MNDSNDKELRELLKKTIVPVKDTDLQRDLWPVMLKEFSRQPVGVPWFDWALAAILSVVLVCFPGAIPALLYHL
jgi:hypothetical protein